MKYLIRLDDACPTMDRSKWERIIKYLNNCEIHPLVGVIPACKDKNLHYDERESDSSFWNRIRRWQNNGCTIALHGYDHCYLTNDKGLNPVNNKSEFAGVPYNIQAKKIHSGNNILIEEGINVDWFFAPAHTYDSNTLKALAKETEIRKISDTIALNPYYDGEFLFCPVQSGHFFKPKLTGTWTFCFHPSNMTENGFLAFEKFILMNRKKFSLDFNSITATRKKNFIDKTLSFFYFQSRRIIKV